MKVKIYKCRNRNKRFKYLMTSWLIMILQGMNPFKKNSWSHMAMGFDGKYFDVTSAGCRERGDFFLNQYDIVGTHELELDISIIEFYEWFNILRDREYDYLQLAGLASKVLGFVSFNRVGSNMRRMICNELVVSHLMKFYNLKIVDSDNWDLVMTWDKAKKH